MLRIIGTFLYATIAIILVVVAIVAYNCYSSGIAIVISLAALFAAILCFTSIIEEENEKKI